MKNQTLGPYQTINAYVTAKLARFDAMEHSFASLFEMMFSERDNILYERTDGYQIFRTTYGQAHDELLRRAQTLRTLLQGTDSTGAVGIYMENSLDWIEVFWAVLLCGRCPLLMNLRVDDTQLSQAMQQSGVRTVISDARRFSCQTILAGELLPAAAPIETEAFGTQVLVMSSGTSGSIKVCAYTAEEFYHQIHDSYQIIRRCARAKRHYEGQLKLLTFLPFYHVFGLIAVYIWFAFFARTFVQLNDLSPQTLLGTIRRHKVTHIFAVPLLWQTVYQQALAVIEARGEKTAQKFRRGLRVANTIADVPLLGSAFRRAAFGEVRDNLFGDSVQFMITGGSAISTQCMEFFNAIGYYLCDGYGMSEIGITSVELSRSAKRRNACYVGKPLSSVEYKIENGELLVRGKTLASYTIENGIKTEAGDWFHTKDLAVCEHGDYRILGRCDDLLVAPNGENLNPNLLEPQLLVPGTRGVCMVAAQKQPVLLVSVKRHMTARQLSEIEMQLRARLQALKLTSQLHGIYYISDALLLPQEFKLNRARLAADLAAGRLSPVTPEEDTDENEHSAVYLRVAELFTTALGRPGQVLSGNADFFLDEGGSSLDYFALISQLQEEYAVAFPTAGGKSLNTVKELSSFIEEHMG